MKEQEYITNAVSTVQNFIGILIQDGTEITGIKRIVSDEFLRLGHEARSQYSYVIKYMTGDEE